MKADEGRITGYKLDLKISRQGNDRLRAESAYLFPLFPTRVSQEAVLLNIFGAFRFQRL